jgi:hypothetical protein
VNKITLRKGEPPEEISPEGYVALYDKVRGLDPEKVAAGARSPYDMTIEEFMALFGDDVSKGAWSKWRRGELGLNFAMEQILRRAGKKQLLELPVLDVVRDHVEPGAAIEMYGAEKGRKIIIIGTDAEPWVLFPDEKDAEPEPEHEVTSRAEPTLVRTPGCDRRRKRRSSIVVEEPLWDRLNQERQKKNLSWADFLSSLIEKIEEAA